MKNLHVLPTNKPSRLYQEDYVYKVDNLVYGNGNQNIYITNDEDIVIKDYYLVGYEIYQCLSSIELEDLSIDNYYKKIILTTDELLIKDGVQAIDDNFLNWFINNPSCEEVEINDWMSTNGNIAFGYNTRYQICNHLYNKKLFSKEEYNPFELLNVLPDNIFYESLDSNREIMNEEYIEIGKFSEQEYLNRLNNFEKVDFKDGVFAGVKWMQENSYSEEEVLKILHNYRNHFELYRNIQVLPNEFFEWFNQFKNK